MFGSKPSSALGNASPAHKRGAAAQRIKLKNRFS